MAIKEKRSFPLMATKHWWALRDRFLRKLPSKADPSYLSTVLGMKPGSACTNVIPTLRMVGLVDPEGNVDDELAARWRDDENYPSVCEEMLHRAYPDELRDACPDPLNKVEDVERWFSNETKAGSSAVVKMVNFYLMLFEADPAKGKEVLKAKEERKITEPKKPKKKLEAPKKPAEPEVEPHVSVSPSIRLDIQIHISPEASADQIDQIFASMAKHFKMNIKTQNE